MLRSGAEGGHDFVGRCELPSISGNIAVARLVSDVQGQTTHGIVGSGNDGTVLSS